MGAPSAARSSASIARWSSRLHLALPSRPCSRSSRQASAVAVRHQAQHDVIAPGLERGARTKVRNAAQASTTPRPRRPGHRSAIARPHKTNGTCSPSDSSRSTPGRDRGCLGDHPLAERRRLAPSGSRKFRGEGFERHSPPEVGRGEGVGRREIAVRQGIHEGRYGGARPAARCAQHPGAHRQRSGSSKPPAATGGHSISAGGSPGAPRFASRRVDGDGEMVGIVGVGRATRLPARTDEDGSARIARWAIRIGQWRSRLRPTKVVVPSARRISSYDAGPGTGAVTSTSSAAERVDHAAKDVRVAAGRGSPPRRAVGHRAGRDRCRRWAPPPPRPWGARRAAGRCSAASPLQSASARCDQIDLRVSREVSARRARRPARRCGRAPRSACCRIGLPPSCRGGRDARHRIEIDRQDAPFGQPGRRPADTDPGRGASPG